MGDCKCVDLVINSKKKRDNRAKHPPPPTLPGASGGRGTAGRGRRAAGGCRGDRRSPSPLQASSLLVVTRGEAVQVRGPFC